ncbi:MAG: hypothetical protein ACRDGJ_12010, partial [Candidatus Limnocylindria bacterium]
MAIQPLAAADPASQLTDGPGGVADLERRGPAGLSDEQLLAAALGGGPQAVMGARALLESLGG